MRSPRRWLDEEGSALGPERELLRAGLSLDPPAGTEDRVWAAVLAEIGPFGGGPGPGGGASAPLVAKTGVAASAAAGASKAAGVAVSGAAISGAAAVGTGVVKSMVVGALGAGVFLTGYATVVPPAPSPRAAATAAYVSEAPAAPAARPQDVQSAPLMLKVEERSQEASLTAPAARVPAAPPRAQGLKVAASSAAPPAAADDAEGGGDVGAGDGASSRANAEHESRLREERQLVFEARAALRSAEAGAALARLDEVQRRFPGGALVQEREALTIEALWQRGDRAAASRRAEAFLRAYPLSPHAARVQTFTQ